MMDDEKYIELSQYIDYAANNLFKIFCVHMEIMTNKGYTQNELKSIAIEIAIASRFNGRIIDGNKLVQICIEEGTKAFVNNKEIDFEEILRKRREKE